MAAGETTQGRRRDEDCQTPGARFATHVGGGGVTIRVDLPNAVVIGERDAMRLESSIHDALERVLAPFFEAGR
jgi:hypothetical protein